MRLIAFYLPQYHPIPENDKWWEKGFTEWTNVTKAKPLYRNHYQPDLPGELGFYDLRLSEVREQQAALAKEHGIEGFMYWHYWFAGKRVLERPFQEVLETKKPNFPFSLGWANETWSGIWHGAPERILIEQTYPGVQDYEEHFYSILEALKDPRYIQVDGKPLFFVYRPFEIPDPSLYIKTWRRLAKQTGLNDIYFVGLATNPETDYEKLMQMGFDAIHSQRMNGAMVSIVKNSVCHKIRRFLYSKKIPVKYVANGIFEYRDFVEQLIKPLDQKNNVFPMLLPNWDNSPRTGKRSLIIEKSTPEKFRVHLRNVLKTVNMKPNERQIVFVKSWNEWGEGNYLEPSRKYGRQYLNIIREELLR